ncbi:MAG: membrane protein insertase YidC [Thermodesulfobacteriota bacterium]
MESNRAILAIVLSVIILVGYQYLFAPPPPPSSPAVTENAAPVAGGQEVSLTAPQLPLPSPPPASPPARPARDITVDTPLYRAVFTENGGGVKSFLLKKYRETVAVDSPPKELMTAAEGSEPSLQFLWGDGAALPFFEADRPALTVDSGSAVLTMSGRLPSGVELVRRLTFSADSYVMELSVDVINRTDSPVQGAPLLRMTNRPFSPVSNSYVFSGPAVFTGGGLEQIKPEDISKEGGRSIGDGLRWTAYEGTYFLCGLIPLQDGSGRWGDARAELSVSGETQVRTVLTGAPEIVPPQGVRRYACNVYFGPKQLEALTAANAELARIVNFGWWDFIAKPTLALLNFLYRYVHNYGVAIILVTIIIKALFWPIAQKGMKSMKTMQKLQPKMAKLREKYGNDKEKLNVEMMQLYKTYKVNPLGGCLPMLLQIPVFFALYKVLLQTIELRHAPFMLWINDLSAPDRLAIGMEIPYLGGIPVLTLLMGASMFLQQKMSPAAGDPTQQKVMMFLPLIFTFMFLNFASGLVLYWLVNNLLSIAQQYFINRQDEA